MSGYFPSIPPIGPDLYRYITKDALDWRSIPPPGGTGNWKRVFFPHGTATIGADLLDPAMVKGQRLREGNRLPTNYIIIGGRLTMERQSKRSGCPNLASTDASE